MKPKLVPNGILALISSPPAAWLLAVALAVPTAQAAVHYQTLRSFGGFLPDAGSRPAATIQGSDGVLYGTSGGGTFGRGTVFKVNKDGTGYHVLYNFGSTTNDGSGPGGLVEGSDGALYGITGEGGPYANQDGFGWGILFKVNKDGTGYHVLYNFGSITNDGSNPIGLAAGSDGALYGITWSFGEGAYTSQYGQSAVFKIAKDGGDYRVLHSFGSTANDGLVPTGLIEGSDGVLYGTTYNGGAYTNQYGQSGTVFKIAKDGSGYGVLNSFGSTANDGSGPDGLIEGSNGVLYGTTYSGGPGTNQYTYGSGTAFKVNKDGTGYHVLYRFGSSTNDGSNPYGLVEGSDGALYGTTQEGGAYTNQYGVGYGILFKVNEDGTGYRVLYSFGSTTNDGSYPQGLVEGSDGVLYGSTGGGGTPTNQFGSGGTVFKLNRDGSGELVLHSFSSGAKDGSDPAGALMEGIDGALYGTTAEGGPAGGGTVFKLNKDASGYSLLHSFAHYEQYPYGALIQGTNGALYGTTGGHRDIDRIDYGAAVFKLNPDGSGYAVLHAVTTNVSNGDATVSAGLVKGTDSWLYGIDSDGVFKLSEDGSGYTAALSSWGLSSHWGSDSPLLEGSDGGLYGISENHAILPMVFKVDASSGGYTALHSFGKGTQILGGNLTEGSDGVLYGTTLGGGAYTDQWGNDSGTVFKLNKDGSNYSVLHNFGSTASDGRGPYARLLEGRDGSLYGTTQQGGAYTNQYGTGLGTAFRLHKDGSGYAVLYNFGSTPNDGSQPQAGLMQASDGAFYGTTTWAGFNSYEGGTLFKLWPPETPDLLGFTTTTNTVQMSFAGMSGYHYRVLRSTDLATWSVLTTITMPPSGVYTNIDTTPPASAAYYRTAWVP